jgi:hypothetical protein
MGIVTEKILADIREEASTSHNRVHVIETNYGWAVKREGAKKASFVKNSKQSALLVANNLRSVNSIIVHNKNGKIVKQELIKL